MLLGLQPAQLVGMAAALLTALAVRAALGGAVGDGAAVLLGGAGLAGALWSVQGQPAGALAWTGLRWAARRAAGPGLSPVPLDGHRFPVEVDAGLVPGRPARGASSRPARRPSGRRPAARPGPERWPGSWEAAPGIELSSDGGGPGERPLGVMRDRSRGTWAAVVPVSGRSFNLLDPPQQGSCLEAWRSVLGAAARAATPVVRLQWVMRRGALGPPPPQPVPVGAGARLDARMGYARLVEETRLVTCGPDTWLVVAVHGAGGRAPNGRRGPRRRAAGVDVLRRELRLLEGQLRAAGLDAGDPLERRGLAELLSGRYRAVDHGGADAAPMAVDEQWDAVRVDGRWHSTYWVAEWPRVEVGPDFLAPLLVGSGRRRVSVVMAPVPADRALREVRSARTADLADAELRDRAGFLSSARRAREAEGVNRREAELADGHSEYRFSGYVTVSADDREGLATACSEMEHAAQSARIELRRLWGRQGEAYTWTLPVARGLR